VTRSWLFAIAHNVVANAHRDRERQRSHHPLDDAVDVADSGASPDELSCAGRDTGRAEPLGTTAASVAD
jgi:DNA-directed RNA polymerase specialized sigma24 family protein